MGRPFDGSLEDVFELQDKVAASVAGAIEPASQVAEAVPVPAPSEPPISLLTTSIYAHCRTTFPSRKTRGLASPRTFSRKAFGRDLLFRPGAVAAGMVSCAA